MTFEMTQKEAHTLAAFIALIRERSGGPEWHKAGIEDALARARKIAPSPDLAIAAIRAAREPSNRTPAVIGMEGPHWQRSNIPARRPYDSNATCGICGYSEVECHRRWQGEHAFESVARSKARHADDETDVARAVAGLRDVKATDPPPETKRVTPVTPGTTGTERVAPIREALHPTPETPTNQAPSAHEEASA